MSIDSQVRGNRRVLQVKVNVNIPYYLDNKIGLVISNEYMKHKSPVLRDRKIIVKIIWLFC